MFALVQKDHSIQRGHFTTKVLENIDFNQASTKASPAAEFRVGGNTVFYVNKVLMVGEKPTRPFGTFMPPTA